jgi:hypothetical protein
MIVVLYFSGLLLRLGKKIIMMEQTDTFYLSNFSSVLIRFGRGLPWCWAVKV